MNDSRTQAEATAPAGRGRAAPSRRLTLGERRVVTSGLERRVFQDLYHYCMTVSWPWFFASWAGLFFGFNLLFACLYRAVPGCIANLTPPGFAGAFFFSVETLATVGYGDMHPATAYGHAVSAVEIFLGMTNIALATGVIFARFSRPTARFLFANLAVVLPMDGQWVLMLRAANARQNIVREASAKLRLIRDTVNPEGYRMRRVADLALVRSEQPLFVLGWNLMHVIDAASPLAGQSAESLRAAGAQLYLSLSGSDETTGQTLMAHHTYSAEALRWNHRFRDVLSTHADGVDHLNYAEFHEVESLQGQSSTR
jgi:inward rectifier potassium channel